jgi:putative ABC transport system permease protein
MEIVGIIGELKQSLATESVGEIYVPYRQADAVLPVVAMSIVIRTAGDPLQQANSVRALARRIDPNQPITGIQTMEQNVAKSISERRFRTVLLGIFAAIALVLAAIGIFGVMAYSVAQRTREFGLRVALGGSRGRLLQLVLAQGARLTLLGVAIGIGASFLAMRYLSTMLFNVRPYDALTLLEVATGLVVVSLSACYILAWRATRISPGEALREE